MKREDIFTLSSCSTSVFPLNNGSFDNNSAIMHPRDHISIAVEYSLAPKSSSGALRGEVTVSIYIIYSAITHKMGTEYKNEVL